MGFLRAHAAITRQLDRELVAEHGLTINDYEVLLHLSRTDEKMLRRVDLAERVLLTPSGITRLLDGLERSGLVSKASCGPGTFSSTCSGPGSQRVDEYHLPWVLVVVEAVQDPLLEVVLQTGLRRPCHHERVRLDQTRVVVGAHHRTC